MKCVSAFYCFSKLEGVIIYTFGSIDSFYSDIYLFV